MHISPLLLSLLLLPTTSASPLFTGIKPFLRARKFCSYISTRCNITNPCTSLTPCNATPALQRRYKENYCDVGLFAGTGVQPPLVGNITEDQRMCWNNGMTHIVKGCVVAAERIVTSGSYWGSYDSLGYYEKNHCEKVLGVPVRHLLAYFMYKNGARKDDVKFTSPTLYHNVTTLIKDRNWCIQTSKSCGIIPCETWGSCCSDDRIQRWWTLRNCDAIWTSTYTEILNGIRFLTTKSAQQRCWFQKGVVRNVAVDHEVRDCVDVALKMSVQGMYSAVRWYATSYRGGNCAKVLGFTAESV
ncbi:hypothetical protein BC829DRAFT_388240 [Chytridium lagenaria]|nr:hypothetical protein BC829DRAFT_388240 [Chytridium lagenaria]